MAQADNLIITSRRNFLVRALGFAAVPAAASAPLLLTKAPVITPDLITAMQRWKQAEGVYQQALSVLMDAEKRYVYRRGTVPASEEREAFNEANLNLNDEMSALHRLVKATV